MADREPRTEIGAGEARVDGVKPVVHRVVLHGFGRSAISRVVHEGVDAAERRHAGRDDGSRAIFDAGVGHQRDRFAPRVAYQRGGLVDQPLRSRGADDLRAFTREEQAHDAPDAFARAGDNRNLPV